MKEVPLEEQAWRDNLHPMSSEDSEIYSSRLADDLKKYCDLTESISQAFSELFGTGVVHIDNLLPDFADVISEISVSPSEPDVVMFN